MRKRLKIMIIVGPTASGKSALAVALCRKFKGEVISADSRQVYKGLNIGTAKISRNEMKGVPHHLISEVSPRETYTAFDFANDASKKIGEILDRWHLPIVAGGTGFYIDALTGRISLQTASANLALRKRLEKKSLAQMLAELERRDPKRAATIDSKNKRRIIRALEIAHRGDASRRRLVVLGAEFDALWLGLQLPKDVLRKKIRARAARQFRQGLLREVIKLTTQRIPTGRIREFGFEYSLALDHLGKKITKDELLEKLEAKTWQYAKRQISYWKRNQNIQWFAPKEQSRIAAAVKKWLRK